MTGCYTCGGGMGKHDPVAHGWVAEGEPTMMLCRLCGSLLASGDTDLCEGCRALLASPQWNGR